MIRTKTKKVILLYLMLLSSSVVLDSCCRKENKLIGLFGFYALNSVGSYPNQTEAIEIIRNDFTLVATFDIQIAGINFPLVSTAYATTCPTKIVNRILVENIQLTCDKSFVYDGDTVQEGANILALQHVVLTFDEGHKYNVPMLYIYFSSDFIAKATFKDSLYNFQLSVPTDDGLVFEKEKELLLLLN